MPWAGEGGKGGCKYLLSFVVALLPLVATDTGDWSVCACVARVAA